MRTILAYYGRKMLEGKPQAGIVALLEREISLIAQLPKYVARTSPIVIVDLQHPGLMTKGQQKIPIRRRINHRIAMRPVRQAIEVTIHIQVIETGPCPDWIPVLIQIYQRIPQHLSRPRVARQIREVLKEISQHN